MKADEAISIEQRLMAGVYSKRPMVAVRGKGARIWDSEGREYIDCMGSYGVSIIGHCHPKLVEAICRQASELISCHGSLYNDKRSEFLEKLSRVTPKGVDRAFLGNSGAEAVECALKLARKYTGKKEIIAMMGAFHGKTMGALSVTWDKKYRTPFEPLVPGIRHVPFGNLDRLREAISPETAAVIVEPIQGEGGIKLPPEGYLKGVRDLCDEKGILLIFDEIQTGLGRTGRMFACEHWSVVPDIMCIGKAIAGGIPMGVTVAKEEVMSAFKRGEHTSTFGGNPLACAAASATLDIITGEGLPERASRLGLRLMEGLLALKEKHNAIREVRGMGLMMGVEMKHDVYNVIMKSLEKGLLILDAGKNVLRFLPPLVIEEAQLDRAIRILDEAIEDVAGGETGGRLPDRVTQGV
ncbi:MAG: aspartate aminotransferase family protein [Candidatus Bathyarchaeia archaeon]